MAAGAKAEGWFDPDIRANTWFDTEMSQDGWWDQELLDEPDSSRRRPMITTS